MLLMLNIIFSIFFFKFTKIFLKIITVALSMHNKAIIKYELLNGLLQVIFLIDVYNRYRRLEN